MAALFVPFLQSYGPQAWSYVLTPGMLILAILANVAYCAVYPIDLFVQTSEFRSSRLFWRPVLWLAGAALAGAITWGVMGGIVGGALM